MKFYEPFFGQVNMIWIGFVHTLPLLLIGIFVLMVTWGFSKLAGKITDRLVTSEHIRPSLKLLFKKLIKIAIWTFGLIITATTIFPSLTPANMLGALGLGSVAVGFAFKDVFENFLAGILIMLREPMRIGDIIDCQGVDGQVEQITIRDTYVRKNGGELIVVPNAHLFKNPVRILTDGPLRRYEITAGVGYGEDINHCREVIKQAVESVDEIQHDKPVQVFAKEFADSAINFSVRWWADAKPLAMHESRDKVITAIKLALDKHNIEIPFPYRTLTFSDNLKIEKCNSNT